MTERSELMVMRRRVYIRVPIVCAVLAFMFFFWNKSVAVGLTASTLVLAPSLIWELRTGDAVSKRTDIVLRVLAVVAFLVASTVAMSLGVK